MGPYTSALKVYGQFVYASTFGAYLFVPRPKFTVKDVPNLSGKVTIVTGGNSGIGKATCKVSVSLHLELIHFVTPGIRRFWKRMRRYILPREAKHGPKLPSRSYWERLGRRPSGSSWTCPLSEVLRRRLKSSTGTPPVTRYPLPRADLGPRSLLQQGI